MKDKWQQDMENGMSNLAKAIERFDDRSTVIEAELATFRKAFPGGDIDGHRRYHELIIEKTDEIRKLRVAIKEKTISALVWSGVVGASMLLWKGLLSILGKVG